MKRRNFKIKLFSILGMASVLATPMFTLTSCGKVSQWYLPVYVNGMGDNRNGLLNNNVSPFNSLRDNPSSAKDLGNETIKDYLQKSYDYILNPSSTSSISQDAYSFGRTHDLYNKDPFIKGQEYNGKTFNLTQASLPIKQSEPTWINNTDNKAYYADYKYKDSADLESSDGYDFRNWNMLTTSNAISTIATNVSQLFAYMLYKQKDFINSDVNQLSRLFAGDDGELDISDRGHKQFTQFYEFYYHLANLMSDGKSHIKFGQSQAKINIFSDLLGSSDGSKTGLGFLPTSDCKDGMTSTNYPYAIKNKDNEVTGYYSIPFFFNVEGLEYAYYDPLTSDRKFTNDNWLITDKTKVDNAISSSTGWNKFNQITGADKKSSSLTFDFTPTAGSINPKTFIAEHSSQEPTFNKMIQSNNSNLSTSTFVGLAQYAVKNISKSKNSETESFPMFTSVSGIYPLFMFQDNKAFKPIDDEAVGSSYIVNKDYLDSEMKKFVSKLTDHSQTILNNYNCQYFFAQYNNDKWDADSNDFIKVVE